MRPNQTVEDRNDATGRQRRIDLNRVALARVRVDHVERTERAAVLVGVVNEVHRPALVGTRGGRRRRRTRDAVLTLLPPASSRKRAISTGSSTRMLSYCHVERFSFTSLHARRSLTPRDCNRTTASSRTEVVTSFFPGPPSSR